jgi:hypothetical protein
MSKPAYYSEILLDYDNKNITFSVSNTFNIPEFYKTCNENDLLHALQLGAEICCIERTFINEKANEGAIGNILTDLKKKHSTEIARKDDIMKREIEQLNEELRCARLEFNSLQNDFNIRIKTQLDDLKTQHSSEVDRLRQQISELVDSRSSVTAETRLAVLAELDSIQTAVLKEKDSMISYLRDKELMLSTKIDSLQEILISRTKSGANAALTGRSGEDDFCSLMSENGIELLRTSGESHMCDYKGSISEYDTLFEVKNHKDRILVKEITKFRRDMKEHPDIRCGVFVGLNVMYSRAGIDGIYGNGSFGIELTAEKQLLIYIGELFKNDIGWLIGVIRSLIESICPLLEKMGENDNNVLAELEGRIRTAVSCVQSIGERCRVLYNKIINDRKAADDAFVGSLSAVKMMREEIQMLLGILLGNTVFVPDSTPITINNEYDMAESIIIDSVDSSSSPKKRAPGGGRKKKVT